MYLLKRGMNICCRTVCSSVPRAFVDKIPVVRRSIVSKQSAVVLFFHSIKYDRVSAGTKVKASVDAGYRR